MGAITTIGLDLAKNVFQVHGVDADGRLQTRWRLRRGDVLKFSKAPPPCLVGIEACATARHWGRETSALGHMVKLMPLAYVKPCIRRGKTDAEAICEAVTGRQCASWRSSRSTSRPR